MFEDEKKFENTQGTETPAAGTTPTPETANPAAGQSAGACDPYAYQNGYYRNTAPHQDEPVNSGAYSQPQTASSGSGSQVPPTTQEKAHRSESRCLCSGNGSGVRRIHRHL